MSKWYEVTVRSTLVYAVEVEDSEASEDAIQFALEDCAIGGDHEAECGAETVGEDAITALKQAADEVLKL